MVGGEGEQRGEPVGGAVVAHQRLGVPRRLGRVGGRQHPGAEPPQRRPLGMVMEQPAAGDHQRRRIVVELAEAVGRLGDEEPVVATVAGDGPQSFEGLHSLRTLPVAGERGASPHRRERVIEAGEEVGAPSEHLGATPHLERTAREGVLRP